MVYKKYIKKGGKTFGPYLYESYRDPSGRVKTRYIPDSSGDDVDTLENPSKRLSYIGLVLAISAILFFAIAFMFYSSDFENGITGFAAEDGGAPAESAPAPSAPAESAPASSDSSSDSSSSADTSSSDTSSSDTSSSDSSPSDSNSATEPAAETSSETSSEIIANPELEAQPPMPPTPPEPALVEETPTEEIPETPAPETPAETPAETPVSSGTEIPASGGSSGETIAETNETEIVPVENETTEIPAETSANETQMENVSEIVETQTENLTEINITIPVINETITNVSEENLTIQELNQTEVKAKITTKQYSAMIGKPVKWTKNIAIEPGENAQLSNITLELPAESGNISVLKIDTETLEESVIEDVQIRGEEDVEERAATISITGNVIGSGEGNIFLDIASFFKRIFNFAVTITGKAIDGFAEENVTIEINEAINTGEEVIVEYYTEAPYAQEKEISNTSKEIVVIGPDTVHYEDVLAYSELPQQVTDKNMIALYWINAETGIKEKAEFETIDGNEDGLIDSISWIVPHLSNQTYEIILITKALHLNSDRILISNIYDSVEALDGIWSEVINDGEYVRVTFERNLTSINDITLYARSVSAESASVEVYAENSDNKIAEISGISSEATYRTLLTGMEGSYDTFDLKINGGIEFDWIVDPSVCPGGMEGDGTVAAPCQINNWTHLNATRDNLDANYTLIADLSSADADYAGIGNNWDPIGGCGADENCLLTGDNVPFTGVFRGNDYTISDLSISPSASLTSFVGLFKVSIGNISNLHLANVNINVPGYDYVGGFSGYHYTGEISNCSSSGTVIGSADVGGLTGRLDGTLSNCSSSGTVDGSGASSIGGLAGWLSQGIINNSYSTANIISGSQVGGLVGREVEAIIANSYATGNVNGSTQVGGLVGYQIQSGVITNSYATGNVNGTGNSVGGLVGDQSSGTISNSYSLIDKQVFGSNNVGALVGYAVATITDCFSIVESYAMINGTTNVGFIGLDGGATVTGSFLTIRNLTYGNITFLELISGASGNAFGNVTILNNSVYVDRLSQPKVNVSANVTLEGLPTDMADPKIYRDGVECNSATIPSCYNFTSLNAGTVIFNVSSWSNYSIRDVTSLTECGTLDLPNTIYTLKNDVSGPCFIIAADNVTINSNGHKITGNITANGTGTDGDAHVNSTLMNARLVGDILATGCSGCVIPGGASSDGGSVTIINSNVSEITTTGTAANLGGVGGAVVLLNSNATIITTSGGGGLAGGVGGAVTLTNSNATTITANGGGDGGNGGNIIINTSYARTITASGGANSGNGGIADIINSTVITISVSGGWISGAGVGGDVNVTNSNVSAITTAGGRLIIQNSTIANITTSGGEDLSGAGEDGGNVTLINSRVLNSALINLTGGTGASDGDSGNIIFNQSSLYNSFGEIKFGYVDTNETNLALINIIANGSAYINPAYADYNSTANITLNTYYNGAYPSLLQKIKVNTIECPERICHNYSVLTSSSVTFNVSGTGNYTIGKFVRSSSNVSMSKGWNMVSLVMETNASGDRNVTLSVGWNLIGFSSDANVSLTNLTFTNLTGNASDLNNSSKNGKLQRQISYLTSASATSNAKKYAFVGKSGSDLALTSGRGYWVKANEAGNLTLPSVAGSQANESYLWRNIMFSNGTAEKNITDAWSAGWVGGATLSKIIYYWDTETLSFKNVEPEDEFNPDLISNFESWKGYFVYGFKDNITMLRQN